MAYVLGFFAADGSMIKNRRRACFIDFCITDLFLLRKIRKALGSNHKISSKKKKKKWKKVYRLQIGSKEFFSDLQKLGLTQNKSKKLRMPKVPKEFLGDFIRGYFDGDGGIYFKKHYAKDRRKKRWIFLLRFTSGSLLFLKDLHKNLKGVTKKGFIQVKMKKGKISGYSLDFSHCDGISLFSLMYDNFSKLFLKRKQVIFLKAINYLRA